MVNLIAAQKLALVVGIVGNESGTAVGRMQGLLQEIEGIDRVVVSSENKGVLDIIFRSGRERQDAVYVGQQNTHHYQQEEGENHIQDRKKQYPVAAEACPFRIRYEYEKCGDIEYSLDDGSKRNTPHLPHGGMTYYSRITSGSEERYQRNERRGPGYGEIAAGTELIGRKIVEHTEYKNGGYYRCQSINQQYPIPVDIVLREV